MPVMLSLKTKDHINPGDFVYLKSGTSWENCVVTKKKLKNRWMIGYADFNHTPEMSKGYKQVIVTVMTPDLEHLYSFFRNMFIKENVGEK